VKDDGVVIGRLTADDLVKIVDHFRIHGLLGSPSRQTDATFTPTPIYFYNDSGATIPPYACLQATGTVDALQNYLKVKKPADIDGTAGSFLVNGPAEVLDKDYGIAQNGPVVRAFKNTGTVAAGGKWRPTVSQWYMTLDTAGLWSAVGLDDIATDVFKIFMPVGGGSTSLFKVTMKAPWSSGVANCDIYSIDGVTFTDTTIDANVYDGLSIFASLTTGDHLLAILQAGKYYAIQAPCP